MKYLAIIFVIYAFIKTVYYGIYEINQKQNKTAGIAIFLIAICGLILPVSILIIFY